jgi:hypothetical protein
MQTQEAKVWNKESIQHLLDSNDEAVSKALMTIYARQTAAEKASQATVEHNGRGFTGTDAEFLSSIASRLPGYGYRLTARQLPHVRRKMRKYWRQLLDEVKLRGGAVDRKVRRKKTMMAPPTINQVKVQRPDQFGLF